MNENMENKWKDLSYKALKKKLCAEKLFNGDFDTEVSMVKLEVNASEIGKDEFIGFVKRLQEIYKTHDEVTTEVDKYFDATLCDGVFFGMVEYVLTLILSKAFMDITPAGCESNISWLLENEWFAKEGIAIFNEVKYKINSIDDWYDFLSKMYKAAL